MLIIHVGENGLQSLVNFCLVFMCPRHCLATNIVKVRCHARSGWQCLYSMPCRRHGASCRRPCSIQWLLFGACRGCGICNCRHSHRYSLLAIHSRFSASQLRTPTAGIRSCIAFVSNNAARISQHDLLNRYSRTGGSGLYIWRWLSRLIVALMTLSWRLQFL